MVQSILLNYMVETEVIETSQFPCKGNSPALEHSPPSLVVLEGVEPSPVGLEHLGWNPPAELYGATSRT